MSKEKTNSLLNCPFCGGELEVHCTSRYYMHKLNGCILQHSCFETDDVESIEKWNNRKPLERIIERLEEERALLKKEREEAIEYDDEQIIFATNNQIRAFDYSLRIIKEEGGMND